VGSERKLRRKASRESRRSGPQSRAYEALEAFASATDVTRKLDREAPCPSCGAGLVHTHSVSTHPAEPGNFTVCIKCGAANRFNEEMQLEPVSDAEVEELPPDVRAHLQDLQAMVRHVKLSRVKRGQTPVA